MTWPRSTPERIYDRLIPDPETGCLLWTGKTDAGYGRVKICQRLRYVHVVAWEIENGPVPEGMDLDHVWDRGCRYRRCALIAHMELVTRRENVMRKLATRDEQERCQFVWQLERQQVLDRRNEYMNTYRARKAAAA